MEASDGRDLYVFRSGRRRIQGALLREALVEALQALTAPQGRVADDKILRALLRAGAYECALADAGAPGATRAEGVTDALAEALLAEQWPAGTPTRLLQTIATTAPPAELDVSPPEGFAYYALDARAYAELGARAAPPPGGSAAVIGIRTIGVTLSAVVAASLRARGVRPFRTTVRPVGHPYRRTLQFTPAQAAALTAAATAGSEFLVVDEGPGLSGASFLSVGEALLALGIPARRIAFLCSRAVDAAALVAPGARERWPRFRALVVDGSFGQPPDARWVGAGEWRGLFSADPAAWPPSWTLLERAKFLSADGNLFFKFEGLGPFGDGARARSAALGAAGYLPPGAGADAGSGYLATPFVRGAPLGREALDARLLEWLADYCAFRTNAFPVADADVDLAALADMVDLNARRELGVALSLPLSLGHAVVPDGRMAPHEIVRGADGALYKLDAVGDGDSHLLPGPTDSAWDLAGTVFEWELGAAAEAAFIDRYRCQSGDDPRARLPAYRVAYGLFRTAYWKMAADTSRGTPEYARLVRAYRRARLHLGAMLRRTP